jgi:hypothetical protein
MMADLVVCVQMDAMQACCSTLLGWGTLSISADTSIAKDIYFQSSCYLKFCIVIVVTGSAQ